ncbi:MAG: hypothetical protein KF895_14570 [Parvibaculum sp.]|nr:hypothetical protein [Parvibaculum sp.]
MNQDHDHSHGHEDGHGHDAHHGPAVTRRTLAILGGTALLAAAIPGLLFTKEPAGSGVTAQEFTALLADPESAAYLGRRFIAEGGAPESAIIHERRLAEALRAEGWSPGMSVEDTHRALAAAVRADYAAARTVSIAEWHLSQTEGSLCVLAAIALRTEDSDAPGNGHDEAHG